MPKKQVTIGPVLKEDEARYWNKDQKNMAPAAAGCGER
jgi:hypothetical protein